ncbi:hypothetical protein M2387_004626 [Klebsiella sp. BIGb0407]|nr:hypothetical protein [Klebsiella sp. BIGb0407]
MGIVLGTATQEFVYFTPIMNLNSPRKEGGIQAGSAAQCGRCMDVRYIAFYLAKANVNNLAQVYGWYAMRI